LILNVFTLTVIFTSLLTLVLLVIGAGSTLLLRLREKEQAGREHETSLENRLYLVFLLVAAALLCRGLSWPLFYLMLQSFIPDVPGAMCIFGTTQVMPALIRSLEVLKPILFFLIGAWFIVYGIDRSTKAYSLTSRKFLFFWALCSLAGLDAIGDMALAITYAPPGIPVTCCTVIGDIQFPVARIKTPAILGTQGGELGTAFYHAIHLFTAGIVAVLLLTRRWDASRKGHAGALWLSLLLGAGGIVITCIAMIDRIGPTLMTLPHHHCPYCLLQYVPVSIAFLCLELLGGFSLGWAFIAGTLGRTELTQAISSQTVRRLWMSACFCLLASWVIVLICLRWVN
jgi:hypothetical protein